MMADVSKLKTVIANNVRRKKNGIDHDRLFKELISTFFIDFVDLFLPTASEFLERDHISFLDKELFTDVTLGKKHLVDLVAKVRFKGQDAFFLVHIETQSSFDGEFSKRMFRYFARLYEKHALPVYPVALFSYNTPNSSEPDTHIVEFPDLVVNRFCFRTIQLNQFHWGDFINKPNPVAAALMSKMKIAPDDRVKVKFECLRMLVTLQLDPARKQLISGFVDTYLKLTAAENEKFKHKVEESPIEEKEPIMEIITSWKAEGIKEGYKQGMQTGIKQGMQQGMQQGELSIVIRLLARKFGELPSMLLDTICKLDTSLIEKLGDNLLDFNKREDLDVWLAEHI